MFEGRKKAVFKGLKPLRFRVESADWVLLRDATRTLMNAIVLIRQAGLRHRIPQEPLEFLSDMNTLCMKMTAINRTKDGSKHRKAVLREMKALSKRIGIHVKKHLHIPTTRGNETNLTVGQAGQIRRRIESIIGQLPAAIHQAHEPIIGGRKLPNGSQDSQSLRSRHTGHRTRQKQR